MEILNLLTEKGVIDVSTSERVQRYAVEHGVSYEHALLEEGIDPEEIRSVLSEYFGLPTRSISDTDKLNPEVLKYIPEESARHYAAVPLKIEDGVLEVGVIDPENLALKDALNFITAKYQIPYKLVLLLYQDLQNGLRSYENITGEVDEALVELESEYGSIEKKDLDPRFIYLFLVER